MKVNIRTIRRFHTNTGIIMILMGMLVCTISCGDKETGDIPFTTYSPSIDGQLDPSLIDLKKRSFNYIWQFDNPITDTVNVTYRMAYTPTHLYLFIETESDSINYRPRGFVNGDGFKFLLATPKNDSITDEYYDMVFSASKDREYWARKRIWDVNHNQNSNKSFGNKTLFEAKNNGKSNGFEALIAWSDVPPYHPFFSEGIGYNLYFAKAIGDTITNGYALVEDEGIWNEELPKRKYTTSPFRLPEETDTDIVVFQLGRKNIIEGEHNFLKMATLSKEQKKETYTISITQSNTQVISEEISVSSANKFDRSQKELSTHQLEIGNYSLEIQSNDGKVVLQDDFTVLPSFNLKQVRQQIEANPYDVNEGAKNTLLFQLEQYAQIVGDLKPYESSAKAIDLFHTGLKEFNAFMNGTDPYKGQAGPYRRAFVSKYDNTLQPYSIKLPKDYDPKTTYPLLVFLHGSGATDVGLLDLDRSGGNFIEIAPYGRDMFKAYASDRSQNDIVEAIEDVSKFFNVDKNNIIIGGFSMGGYGSLRTFYEHPELFKGVVVQAGHPNLANYWLGGDYPNFLKPEYLERFKTTRVFVYHGKKDGSLPVRKIEAMISKMEELNIDVTYSIASERGHQYPDDATNGKYYSWLNETVN